MKKTLLLTILIFVFGGPIVAQSGGGCSKAIPITSGIHVVDSMIAGVASFKDIRPNPTKAIWYKFSPIQDGLMHISACSGGADTRLFVYVGNCDTLNLFGSSDDYCAKNTTGEETASDIYKYVKAGKTYFIEWDNAWDSMRFSFTLSFSSNYVPTEKQACQSAKAIKPGLVVVDSIFGFASHGDAGHANWYKYTPTSQGRISISSCGIDADTRLWIYKGDCNTLVSIASGDDECDGETQTELAVAINDLDVVANTTYYFEWDDSWENAPFEFSLTFDPVSTVKEEAFSQKINVAPNPTSDFVNVQFFFDNVFYVEMKIYNSSGQVVLARKIGSVQRWNERLDVKDLASGIYYLEIMSGAHRTSKKLFVNH
jgi:hypothetical protein